MDRPTIDNEELRVAPNRYIYWKGMIEFFISLFLLVLLSPLLFLVCVSIKCCDWQAPIFFKQVRVGKNEQTFLMYKFRTMYPGAEKRLHEFLDKNEIDGPMFKLKNDPRITKIGRFLRKTSLDELPQLVNVLRGEMALIGPRPPLEREVAEYSDTDKKRLTITPGCTGLWQVSGRNELSFHEMVVLDLYYIDNLTVWLDLKIFVKTIGTVLLSKGAF